MKLVQRWLPKEEPLTPVQWEPDLNGARVAQRLQRTERELSTLGIYIDAMSPSLEAEDPGRVQG